MFDIVLRLFDQEEEPKLSFHLLFKTSTPNAINVFALPDSSIPLSIACHKGRVEVVKLLISSDIGKSDRRGGTPLSIACQQVHIGIVKLLTSNGADIGKHGQDGFTSHSL